MFIVSFRLDHKKVIIGAFVLLFVVILGLSFSIKTKTTGQDIFNTMQKKLEFNFKNVKTNEDRVTFLKQFEWEVEPDPIEIQEVQLPEELDQVYLNYNEIQKEMGLNLEKYKGKRVKRYTYKVLNYPEKVEEEVRANIYIYKDRVVAGDIMSTKLDGFMHSLLYRMRT